MCCHNGTWMGITGEVGITFTSAATTCECGFPREMRANSRCSIFHVNVIRYSGHVILRLK